MRPHETGLQTQSAACPHSSRLLTARPSAWISHTFLKTPLQNFVLIMSREHAQTWSAQGATAVSAQKGLERAPASMTSAIRTTGPVHGCNNSSFMEMETQHILLGGWVAFGRNNGMQLQPWTTPIRQEQCSRGLCRCRISQPSILCDPNGARVARPRALSRASVSQQSPIRRARVALSPTPPSRQWRNVEKNRMAGGCAKPELQWLQWLLQGLQWLALLLRPGARQLKHEVKTLFLSKHAVIRARMECKDPDRLGSPGYRTGSLDFPGLGHPSRCFGCLDGLDGLCHRSTRTAPGIRPGGVQS